MDKLVGYKAFDKDLKCRDKQYSVGETAIHTGDVSLCSSGLHFCEYPLDVFYYYPPASSRFAEVYAEDVSSDISVDSKRVAKRLTIKTELSLHAMIDAAVKFTTSKIDLTKAQPSNSGDYGAASNSGDYGAASNSGDYGAASNSGKEGVAMSVGIGSKARGSKGSWLVLSEWKTKDGEWRRINVKSAKVDGKKIKADTYYTIKNGRFVEAQ